MTIIHKFLQNAKSVQYFECNGIGTHKKELEKMSRQ